jgi:hypothetical protein
MGWPAAARYRHGALDFCLTLVVDPITLLASSGQLAQL